MPRTIASPRAIAFLSRLSFVFLVTGCAGRSSSVPPTVLAAADPSAPETPYTSPPESMAGEKPRTLDLEIQSAPSGGMEGMEGMDHSKHGGATNAKTTPKDTPKEATVYTCPMHPEIRESKPGKCPKCGMTLVPAEKKKEVQTPAPAVTPKPSGHEGHGGTP